MASTQNRDRANQAPATETGYADRIPIARPRARQRKSVSAMPACFSGALTSSWTAPFDEFFAERVPDMLEQFCIARGFAHLYRVARPRNVHLEHILDLAGTRREQDDTVGQCQGFTEIVCHEQNGLLLAVPYPQQDFVHINLGVSVERTKGFIHQ